MVDVLNRIPYTKAEIAGQYINLYSVTNGSGSSIKVTDIDGLNTILGFPTEEVKGFNSVDAIPGRNLETDVEFRLRRSQTLQLSGSATLNAVYSKIRNVIGVRTLQLIENDTDTTDINGLTPHSIEAVIQYDDPDIEQDIAEAIFSKAAGIATNGDQNATVIDNQGNEQEIKWSKVEEVPIFMLMYIYKDPLYVGTENDLKDAIKLALKTEGDNLGVGQDVIALRFRATPLKVYGVIDVNPFAIWFDDNDHVDENIEISPRQIATFDLSDIEVNIL
jgi:hypothetical protein